jgi:hypothetical protein
MAYISSKNQQVDLQKTHLKSFCFTKNTPQRHPDNQLNETQKINFSCENGHLSL